MLGKNMSQIQFGHQKFRTEWPRMEQVSPYKKPLTSQWAIARQKTEIT
jgi:hypothetical protein